MALPEALLQLDHFAQANRVDRRHANRAAAIVFQRSESRLELLPATQHIAAKLLIKLACGRHNQRPSRPIQQRHPKHFLQFLYLLAGCGLAHSVEDCGSTEAARFSDVPEKLETI